MYAFLFVFTIHSSLLTPFHRLITLIWHKSNLISSVLLSEADTVYFLWQLGSVISRLSCSHSYWTLAYGGFYISKSRDDLLP